MSKASRQKYAAPGATVRDATPEEAARLTVADVVIRAPAGITSPIAMQMADEVSAHDLPRTFSDFGTFTPTPDLHLSTDEERATLPNIPDANAPVTGMTLRVPPTWTGALEPHRGKLVVLISGGGRVPVIPAPTPTRPSPSGDLSGPYPAPDPLLTALRDLARVMAAETLRQMAHCSRCDRPARFASGFTGSLCCQVHRDEQAALGQASFTALPVPVVAERLYAFVMGEE